MPSSDQKTNEIYDKIVDWLIEEQYNPLPKEDTTGTNDFLLSIETTLLNFVITKPQLSKRIVVGTSFKFNENDQKLFKSFDLQIRRPFKFDLLRDLMLMKLVVATDPHDIETEFKSIRIMEPIYYDGLSKDRLLGSVNNIIRGYAILMHHFEKHIPSFSPTPDKEFI